VAACGADALGEARRMGVLAESLDHRETCERRPFVAGLSCSQSLFDQSAPAAFPRSP
jgi:hypothetical protein